MLINPDIRHLKPLAASELLHFIGEAEGVVHSILLEDIQHLGGD